MSRSRRMVWATLAALLAVAPGRADAQMTTISDFQTTQIVGNGSLELDDRIGGSFGDTEHIINIQDCRDYAGGEAEVSWQIGSNPFGDWLWGAAYSRAGSTCRTNDSSFTDEDEETCRVTLQQAEDLTATSGAFDVELDFLMGNNCDAGTERNAFAYVVFEETGTGGEIDVAEVKFRVDLRPPVAPVVVDVSGGDRRIEVDWDDEENDPSTTSYVVYYSTDPIPDEPTDDVRRKDDVEDTGTSLTSGVSNGVTYHVRVAAEDDAENIGPLSEELTVVPVETLDFWEQYLAAGGTEEGGFCFVATAAYGTTMTADLDVLRTFRDRVLLGSAPGRAFVDGYYRWGRFAAAWIADKPAVRAATRVALVPLVWTAHLTTSLPPLGAAALLLAGLALATAGSRRLRERILRDVPLEARR